MELFHANKQWSTRPDDERFTSIQSLHDACKSYASTATEREGVAVASLRVENVEGDIQLIGKGNIPARVTNWAFGQLAARIGAPASYLRTLPATLAAQNINHGLANKVLTAKDAVVNLLLHRNGGLLVRALTSDKYSRIWNWEVTERLLDLQSKGWDVARPDIRVGDGRLPLYASDHDMFAFIAHSDRTIDEPGNPGGLKRGMIIGNSEVGASTLFLLRFLYREMCGNHIIWGAEEVIEMNLRHVGNIRQKMSMWDAEFKKYFDESASTEEAKIEAAMHKMIAATKDEVLDAIFGKKIPNLTRKALTAGYEANVPDQDGDPRTVWGFVQGMTRYSQTLAYGDNRTDIDIAAGKLIDIDF